MVSHFTIHKDFYSHIDKLKKKIIERKKKQKNKVSKNV